MADWAYRVEKTRGKWKAVELKDGTPQTVEINDFWEAAIIDVGKMRRERRASEIIGFRR